MARTKSQRREHILSAAEELFQHYGFTKTTVADIARAARVGVGTVYLEFSSKETIASELSLRRYSCVLDAMRAAAESPGSHAERFAAMFQAGLERLSHYTCAGPHGKELIHGGCAATERAHFREREESLITEFLNTANETGEFQIADPRQTARVLLRLYHSYSQAADLDQARAELAAAHALLLRGLLARD